MAVTFRRTVQGTRGARVATKYNPLSLIVGAMIQWEETKYQGAVLDRGSRSVRIMSDVWATETYVTVWDSEKSAPRDVSCRVVDHNMGGSDSPWDDWYTFGIIDATDEVKARYAQWQDEQEEKRILARFESNLKEAKNEALEVKKGSRVEVYKGRKVPKGTTGECFWLGQGRYGWRCGIKDDDGEAHWTALSNVRVIGEDWSDSCQDCGGKGWLPAYDGKGGTVSCPACDEKAAQWAAEREAEHKRIKAELESGSYIGRGTTIEVTESNRKDAAAGTIGEVFWRGQNRYGAGDRVGFKDDAGVTHWANLENVQIYNETPLMAAPPAMAGNYAVPSPASFGF